MSIFLTGATGFIGNHLLKRLVADGHTVYAVVRRPADANYIKILGGIPVGVSLKDKSSLVKYLAKADIVYHLAAVLNVWGAPWNYFKEENVQTTRNLIEAMPLTVKKFIYLSTVHALGVHHQKLPIDEASSYQPSTLYARSKVEAEELVKGSNLPYVIARPAMVYGPGDKRGFVANLINLIKNKKIIPLPGSGKNFVHLVYIDDLIDGLISIIGKENAVGQTYIFAGPKPIRTRDLAGLISAALGKSIITVSAPLWLFRWLAVLTGAFAYWLKKEPLITRDRLNIASGNRFFSIEKAGRELGYSPRIDYKDGIAKIILDEQGVFSEELIKKIASEKGTPLFLFSEAILIDRYRTLHKSLSKHYSLIRIYYSAKTNFNCWVLKKLAALGSDLEIACGQELLAATQAGFQPRQVCFDGPVKTDEDIAYAIKAGINYFNFDSLTDAEKVNAVAKRLNKRVRGGFRIDVGIKQIVHGPAELYIRKFGVPIGEARDFYKKARRLSHLDLEIISCHVGSQIAKIEPYLREIKLLVDLAAQLEELGLVIKEINLGGGFPSASLAKTTIFNFLFSFLGIRPKATSPALEFYGEAISKKFAQATRQLKNKPILGVEPGRSIASPMGILISRVKVLKNKWIFLDASKYFMPESAFFARQKIVALPAERTAVKLNYHLVGASLNTADIFSMDEPLPELSRDDLVIIFDAGAYSISRAIPFTILLPPVYAVDLFNKIHLIKRKGIYEDSFSTDIRG